MEAPPTLPDGPCDPESAGFTRFGPVVPDCPVVLAVPHAGRDYPPALHDAVRGPIERLVALEDRLVDRLVEPLAARGMTTFVANTARAWIDLNRDERELDPAMVLPPPSPERLIASARVRGGLGLIPRRLAGLGDVWLGAFGAEDVAARIGQLHRPYHAALARSLGAARTRFGAAVLLDCHSMPSLGVQPGSPPSPTFVVGDRHGRSASARLVAIVEAAARSAGLRASRNAPYAGGHTLDRHGQPGRGIHAIQIEIDRKLYLDREGHEIGEGAAAITALIEDIVGRLADALLNGQLPVAAE